MVSLCMGTDMNDVEIHRIGQSTPGRGRGQYEPMGVPGPAPTVFWLTMGEILCV